MPASSVADKRKETYCARPFHRRELGDVQAARQEAVGVASECRKDCDHEEGENGL